jgi:hypothetical protein
MFVPPEPLLRRNCDVFGSLSGVDTTYYSNASQWAGTDYNAGAPFDYVS